MNLHDELKRLSYLSDGRPHGVADYLYSQGCKGERDHNKKCPVAIYLIKRGFHGVSVTDDYAYVGGESEDMPTAIALFIRAFDKGEHEKLLEVA